MGTCEQSDTGSFLENKVPQKKKKKKKKKNSRSQSAIFSLYISFFSKWMLGKIINFTYRKPFS